MEILFAVGLFALAFLGLGLRTWITGKPVKESCGGGGGDCACGGSGDGACRSRRDG